MAVTSTETPAKKIKKRASVADLAPTPAPTPDGVAETAKKRKKKHADAVANNAGSDETPVKMHKKEKKVVKDRAEDLELVVTRLDDEMSKKEKKKSKAKSETAAAEESVSDIEEAVTPKKRKRKSEAAPTIEGSQETAKTQTQEKKRKHKVVTPAALPAPDVEEPMSIDTTEAVVSTSQPTPSKKEKKRRKSEAVPMEVDTPAAPFEPEAKPVEEAGPSTSEPVKKKKKQKKADAPPAEAAPEVTPTAIEPVTPAKEKKRKRKAAEDTMDVDTPAKPAKKSKAGAMPDPSSDEGLSSSGKEALTYAYTHYKDLAAFKFNKAKQSWLVRNMWKLDEIPEAYTPLLAHYLGTVQGQLRKSLPNICKDKIEATDEPEPIRARAQVCRDALAANEPAAPAA